MRIRKKDIKRKEYSVKCKEWTYYLHELCFTNKSEQIAEQCPSASSKLLPIRHAPTTPTSPPLCSFRNHMEKLLALTPQSTNVHTYRRTHAAAKNIQGTKAEHPIVALKRHMFQYMIEQFDTVNHGRLLNIIEIYTKSG